MSSCNCKSWNDRSATSAMRHCSTMYIIYMIWIDYPSWRSWTRLAARRIGVDLMRIMCRSRTKEIRCGAAESISLNTCTRRVNSQRQAVPSRMHTISAHDNENKRRRAVYYARPASPASPAWCLLALTVHGSRSSSSPFINLLNLFYRIALCYSVSSFSLFYHIHMYFTI